MNTAYELLDNRLSDVFAASVSTCRLRLPGIDYFSGQNVAASCFYRKRSPFCYERKSTFHTLLVHPYHTSLVQMIAQLSASANNLSDALTSCAHEIKSIHIAQANAVRATTRLAGTLEQMDETVISALVEINNTAIRVNQTIGKSLNAFHPNLVSMAGAIIHREDDPDRISGIATDRYPVKQISLLRLAASAVVWLVWFILQQSSSFLVMVGRLVPSTCGQLDNLLVALCCRHYLSVPLVTRKNISRKRAWALSRCLRIQGKFSKQADISRTYNHCNSSRSGDTLAPPSRI